MGEANEKGAFGVAFDFGRTFVSCFSLLYGRISQELGTTEFTNLIHLVEIDIESGLHFAIWTESRPILL